MITRWELFYWFQGVSIGAGFRFHAPHALLIIVVIGTLFQLWMTPAWLRRLGAENVRLQRESWDAAERRWLEQHKYDAAKEPK